VLRRISLVFIIVFLIEITILSFLLAWCFVATADNQLERVKIISSTLVTFGSLFLTSGLVYHNFWQHPELRIIGILVRPLDSSGQDVAKPEYRKACYRIEGHNPQTLTPFDQMCPQKENGALRVECSSRSSKIRISASICNIGINETTIRECTNEELKPVKGIVGIYSYKESLPHQGVFDADFDYPVSTLLKDGDYEFRITVVAATEKRTRRLHITISDDCKTVVWWEIDC